MQKFEQQKHRHSQLFTKIKILIRNDSDNIFPFFQTLLPNLCTYQHMRKQDYLLTLADTCTAGVAVLTC